jgi:hypothetical protein
VEELQRSVRRRQARAETSFLDLPGDIKQRILRLVVEDSKNAPAILHLLARTCRGIKEELDRVSFFGIGCPGWRAPAMHEVFLGRRWTRRGSRHGTSGQMATRAAARS